MPDQRETITKDRWSIHRPFAGIGDRVTLPLTVALLALWSVAMYRYGRSVLFPPASLGIVWTITLFAIWLCGDLYFPLTTRAR